MILAFSIVTFTSSASARGLPDGRRYELVTRYVEHGREVGLNGVNTGFGVPSIGGDSLDWAGLGGCCGASTGAENLYQSNREAGGWQTKSLTPAASEGLDGFFEEQAPMFFTNDLQRTIWATPASYASGDHRPKYSAKYDLYLQEPTGALRWLSQGPEGTGSGLDSSEFDAATPDASEVVFSSAEHLTADANGLASMNTPPQYLYVRDIADETTHLVSVDNNDEVISPYGAAAGNGGWLDEQLVPTDSEGTTTNSISADGAKVFFEAPPPGVSDLPPGQVPHLYMRDLVGDTTTALDNPAESSPVQYEGASTDGSLVFFTSSEGLNGAPVAKELYEFNTTASAIGSVPAMSATPLTTASGGILGVSAIANDGSHVYFVAEEALVSNLNPVGRTAVSGQPNLYVYDTHSGTTTFVATLASPDVSRCDFTCGSGSGGGLVAEPDIARPVYPTPDGQVFVFGSTAEITSEYSGPATTLTAPVEGGAHTLVVESTAGFAVNRTIAIGTGSSEELATIETIDSPTEITLTSIGPTFMNGLVEEHPSGSIVTELYAQYYRYSLLENSLVCITCTPAGVSPTGSANLGASGGGSYAPPGQTVPMSADGSEIFFASPDALVPEVQTVTSSTSREPTNVYEWHHGHVSLISDGSSTSSALDGTTPSGRDVFFATRAQLAPSTDDGYQKIYDARVEGGFPAPAGLPLCEASDCRTPMNPDVMFSAVPGSAIGDGTGSLDPRGLLTPAYAVSSITAAQRRRLTRTGILRLTVSATAGGKLLATVYATVHGRGQRVAHATGILAGAGKIRLTLRLSRAARSQLALSNTLRLHLEVTDSVSPTVALADIVLDARAGTTKSRTHLHHA